MTNLYLCEPAGISAEIIIFVQTKSQQHGKIIHFRTRWPGNSLYRFDCSITVRRKEDPGINERIRQRC